MESEYLYEDALAGEAYAKLELQERAKRVSKQNRTILHNASKEGSLVQVRYILNEFASNNFLGKLDSNKETALHAAVCNGKIEVVEGLIDAAKYWPASADHGDPSSSIRGYKAFIRQANRVKNTALHLALKNRYWLIAKLLVEADPSFRYVQNSDGESPVYLALKNGHWIKAHLLVEADPSYRYVQNFEHDLWEYIKLVKMMCEDCEAPTVDGPDGELTALQYAIIHLPQVERAYDVVKVLIEAAKRGLPPTKFKDYIIQANDNKDTALHLAVQRNNREMVRVILEADPSFPQGLGNKDSKTAVYIAAENGYEDMVKLLCQTSPSWYVTPGPRNQTPLHVAIIRRHSENTEDESDVVKVLVEAAKRAPGSGFEAFPLRQADDNDDTALHLAVQRNYKDVVKLILEADPSFPQERINKDLKTAVYIAAEKGYKEIVELLCDNSPSGYVTPGPKNQTALHVAIIGRHTDCVRCLLSKAGCPVTSADDSGWTALHWAAHQKFDSILDDIFNIPGYRYVYPDKVTPLFIAAEEGHTSTVTKLIQLLPASTSNGMSRMLSHVNRDGQNMLHIAASKSDKDTVQSILKNCPPESTRKLLNKQDNHGNTPLHLLVREGCYVPELIKHKGIENIMTTNNQNYTPLDMLYLKEEDIVEDQLQIKKALENTHSKQQRKCWPRRTEEKLSMQESIVPPRIRAKKDALLNKANKKLMQEELKFYRQRTNTQIIVTALITTVTFTVGFTLPGGYYQSGDDDGGMALLSKRAAFNAFMVTDALALALSTTSLFFYFISTMYQDPNRVSKFNLASTVLNIVSVIAMMLTFLTGTYVVLSKSPALAITVCVIICLFFLLVIVLSIQMLFNRKDLKIEKTEV